MAALVQRAAGMGRGSTFTVTLPMSTDEEEASTPEVETVVSQAKRVLVVDDNQDAADSLALLLSMAGHQVKVARDGVEALGLATQFKPNTILVDIGLPGMDGYELAQRLRELPSLGDVQLVALTGHGQETGRSAAAAAGFHIHLTKPVDPDAVLRLFD